VESVISKAPAFCGVPRAAPLGAVVGAPGGGPVVVVAGGVEVGSFPPRQPMSAPAKHSPTRDSEIPSKRFIFTSRFWQPAIGLYRGLRLDRRRPHPTCGAGRSIHRRRLPARPY